MRVDRHCLCWHGPLSLAPPPVGVGPQRHRNLHLVEKIPVDLTFQDRNQVPVFVGKPPGMEIGQARPGMESLEHFEALPQLLGLRRSIRLEVRNQTTDDLYGPGDRIPGVDGEDEGGGGGAAFGMAKAEWCMPSSHPHGGGPGPGGGCSAKGMALAPGGAPRAFGVNAKGGPPPWRGRAPRLSPEPPAAREPGEAPGAHSRGPCPPAAG